MVPGDVSPGDRRLSPVRLTLTAAAAGALATLLVSMLPFIRFAYRSPSLHVALETADALIGLLLAYLIYGRFRRFGRVQDLLLVYALATFGVAAFVFSALPSTLRAAEPGVFTTWAPLTVRFAGTIALAAAAALTTARVRNRRAPVRYALGWLVLLVGVAVAIRWFEPHLPVAVDPALSPESSERPRIVGHPVVLGAQLVTMTLFAYASFGFTRQAQRTDDELLRWVGAGCALAAFSRLNFFLFPSLYSEWLYTGDFLRTGFYVLLLVGATREIRSYWTAQSRAAVLEDRRRMARDLHDGLAQELTYIWSQTRRLRSQPGNVAVLDQVNRAAERAIDEAREAIAALSQTEDESLPRAVSRAAEEVAGRYGVDVELDLDDCVLVSPEEREEIVRIVREAVGNAARHGHAHRVDVRLRGGEQRELLIADDGTGFDPSCVGGRSSGFGLTSMRERAERLGGRLHVDTAPGHGTKVGVRWRG